MKTTIIGLLLSPFLLMGQQNNGTWTNIGPSPAAVSAIAVDPGGTGTIFMSTLAGGIRKSVDAGITWSAANTGLTDLEVMTLAMDASGPQTVYAGDPGGGLSKTIDGGSTWQIIPAISGAIASVAADPNRSGVVYTAVFNNLANGSIRKSIDGGVTWATVFPTTAAIFSITIDPGNPLVPRSPPSHEHRFRLLQHLPLLQKNRRRAAGIHEPSAIPIASRYRNRHPTDRVLDDFAPPAR